MTHSVQVDKGEASCDLPCDIWEDEQRCRNRLHPSWRGGPGGPGHFVSCVTCYELCHVLWVLSRVMSCVTCYEMCHVLWVVSRVMCFVTCYELCHVLWVLSRVMSCVTFYELCHVLWVLSRVLCFNDLNQRSHRDFLSFVGWQQCKLLALFNLLHFLLFTKLHQFYPMANTSGIPRETIPRKRTSSTMTRSQKWNKENDMRYWSLFHFLFGQ